MKTQRLQTSKLNKRLGLFSLSAIAALVLTAAFISPLTSVEAADPTSGSVGPAVGSSVTWNGTSPGGTSPEGETTCVENVNCETYTLTVADGDWTGKLIKVKINWTLPASDYDFYIHKGSATGPEVARSGQSPPVIEESANIDPSTTGTGTYAIRVVYWAVAGAGDQYIGTATVDNKSAGGVEPTPPPVSTAAAPTYDNFVPPSTLGQRAGEPTIGLNWATGKAMFIASLQTLRVSFDDAVSPATAAWENKSAPNTSATSFDPILFTDSGTNRTFVSQLVPGLNKIANPLSFTDDDGNTWTPSQGSGINSGVDHQTVGGGPYAKNPDGSLKGGAIQRPGLNTQIYPNAVYYASQDIGVAEISRSDDGGLTFGAAVPMYDLTQCGGLHGHIKVAADGTVYVPNKGCGEQQAVAVSEDNGLTWSIRKIPGSTRGVNDPSVGIGTDGTIYVGYANGDGTPRIAVSHDRGNTFVNDQNIGYYQGIRNTVFPAVTAGDPDRAAFFFLGTTTGGSAATGTDQVTPYVDAVWYGFISTTYDGGKTWVTVNATPNDPVQRGVVCTNGTTCPAGTRNLLDFNDMEVDKQGRAVAALADGCITEACKTGVDINGDGQLNTRFDNDGGRRALIIRQSSGLGLFSAFDPPPANNTVTVDIEDDDRRVAYSNGWHKVSDPSASAGHYRMNNGKSPNHFARLDFEVAAGQNGSIVYHYRKTSKGGTAQVFLDGNPVDTVNFKGSGAGSTRPYPVSSGTHSLEIRDLNGTTYIDKFTLTTGTSNAKPASGPGATNSSTNTINAGGELLKSVNVEQGAKELSVMAESDAPIRLVVVDPRGSILGISDAANGVASVDMPVSQGGTYLVKVVNLNVGPIQVFTASTALVAR